MVERRGDAVHIAGGDRAYSDSLYINIPAAALPTQLAEITLGESGPLSYETNLGSDHEGQEGLDSEELKNYYRQSTPIRLFYGVGLEESLIVRDADGKQTGVNVADLPADYIATHTEEDGDIYFLSNYYSGKTYAYGTDVGSVERTRGDPALSFSPSTDNRYYIFQKPLPLFKHAFRVIGKPGEGGSTYGLRCVDNVNNWGPENRGVSNKDTRWEDNQTGGTMWAGGEYMGTYKNEAAYRDAVAKVEEDGGYITDSNGKKFPFKAGEDGGIIFFEQNLLSADNVNGVTNGTGTAAGANSQDFYFIIIEYYLPDKTKPGVDDEGDPVSGTYAARPVQYVVCREGSEFGLAYGTEGITSGDFVCWTDRSNVVSVTPRYDTADSGDKTRGAPTMEKLTKTGAALEQYLTDECKIPPDKVEEEAAYWLEMQKQMLPALDGLGEKGSLDGIITEDEYKAANLEWVLAAKKGGLRVGDMFRNVGNKGDVSKETDFVGGYYVGNHTKTANNYYMPTVSQNSTSDAVVLNNYLGNNGRLSVPNSLLYVTKQLDIPQTDPNYDALIQTEFDYQVYIEGMTGEVEATLLRFNHWANNGQGTWQRQISTIDATTSNEGLLYDSGTTTLSLMAEIGGQFVHVRESGGNYYRYDDGKPVPVDELYYIYVGDDDGGNMKRVFENSGNDQHKTPGDAGRTVYLTPGASHANRVDPADEFWTVYKTEDANNKAGSLDFWLKSVTLVPKTEVDDATGAAAGISLLSDGPTPVEIFYGIPASEPVMGISTVALDEAGGWTYAPGTRGHVQLGYTDGYTESGSPFVIAHADQVEDSSNVLISSEYAIEFHFMTKKLYFGSVLHEETGEKGADLTADMLFDKSIPNVANTAQFKLGHEEGVMFSGLSQGVDYTITERIDDASDFTLRDVTHRQELGETVYDSDRADPPTAKYADSNTFEPGTFSASFGTGKDGSTDFDYYSVKGDISVSMEEGARYVNRYDPGNLTITKQVSAEEGVELNRLDRTRMFDFTLTLEAPAGSRLTVEGPFTYSITGPVLDENGEPTGRTETVKKGNLLAFGAAGTTDPNDIAAESASTWKFQLSDGQTMSVSGLPVGTGYSYTATEDPATGYEVTDSEEAPDTDGETTVSGTVAAGSRESARVTFTNTKQKPEPAELALDLTKSVADESDLKTYMLQEGAFSFRVTPSMDNPTDDPIRAMPEFDAAAGFMTVKNGASADGKTAPAVIFPAGTKFATAGKYDYTVREIIPSVSEPGVTYDGQSYAVTVNVTEDYGTDGKYTGKLKAEVTVNGENGEVIFTNEYNPNRIGVTLQAEKSLLSTAGEALPVRDGDFTFTLKGISAEYTEEDRTGGEPGTISTEPEPVEPDESESAPTESEPAPASESEPAPAEPQPGNGLTFEEPEEPEDSGESVFDFLSQTSVETGGLVSRMSLGEEDNPWSFFGATDPDTPIAPEPEPDESTMAPLTEDGTDEPLSEEPAAPTDMPMPEISTVKVSGDGRANFGPIRFTRAGVYVYEITEVNEGRYGVTYDERTYTATVTVSRNADDALFAEVTYSDGTVSADDAAFVNTMTTGGLTVTKRVTGTAADLTKSFAFTVTITDETGAALESIDGKYGEMEFVKGAAAFTLKDGESRTAENLPTGVHYKVEEADYSEDGWTVTYTGQADGSGTIQQDTVAEVTAENRKDKEPGSLTVRKTVTGAGDKQRAFNFAVTFTPADGLENVGITKNGEPAPGLAIVGGTLRFTLSDGESVEITGIPADTQYAVTEEQAAGYTTTSSGETGTIPEGGRAEARFVNDVPQPQSTPIPPAQTVRPMPTPNASVGPKETPIPVPPTGDTRNYTGWIALMAMSVSGMLAAGLLLVRERRNANRKGRHAR